MNFIKNWLQSLKKKFEPVLPPVPEIGQLYRIKPDTDNPFERKRPTVARPLAVKNGWVQYRVWNDYMPEPTEDWALSSRTNKMFLTIYGKDNEEND